MQGASRSLICIADGAVPVRLVAYSSNRRKVSR